MAGGEAKVVALAVVLPLLAVAATSARFYARRIRHTKLGIDDWLTGTGTVLVIGMGIAQLVGESTTPLSLMHHLTTQRFWQEAQPEI